MIRLEILRRLNCDTVRDLISSSSKDVLLDSIDVLSKNSILVNYPPDAETFCRLYRLGYRDINDNTLSKLATFNDINPFMLICSTTDIMVLVRYVPISYNKKYLYNIYNTLNRECQELLALAFYIKYKTIDTAGIQLFDQVIERNMDHLINVFDYFVVKTGFINCIIKSKHHNVLKYMWYINKDSKMIPDLITSGSVVVEPRFLDIALYAQNTYLVTYLVRVQQLELQEKHYKYISQHRHSLMNRDIYMYDNVMILEGLL